MATPFSDLRLTQLVGPFVTVSPRGIVLGTSTVPNDGAMFGPDNDTTGTVGIQDALNSISSSGGTVFLFSGTYNVGAAIGNTGNRQTVIIQPGTTLVFNGEASGGIHVAQDTAATTAYYYCSWFGNGCILTGPSGGSPWTLIDLNITAASNWPSGQAPYMIVVDGFEVTNFANTGIWLQVGNSTITPTIFQCLRQLRMSRIYVHNYSGTGALVIGGSVKYCSFERIVIDGSATPTTSTMNVLAAVPANGDIAHLEFHHCFFESNGDASHTANGNAIYLSGWSEVSLLADILFENCEFYCPSTHTSPGMGGTGGLDLLDVSTSVTNVDFVDCLFNSAGVTYAGSTPATGFVKFHGGYPPATSGSLAGRSPGQVIGVPTTGTGTPLTYLNQDGFDELLIVSGGTGVAITLNGQSVGVTSGVFEVKTGDTLVVSWTSGTGNNPTVNKCPA